VLTPACGAVAVAFAANHRSVLEDLFNMNDGANWREYEKAGWMTDAPLNEWRGVTADEDDNVTELNFKRNSSLTGIAVFKQNAVLCLTRVGL
jgi:hypothetical protein